MQMYTRCQPGLINKHTPLKCYVALTFVCLFHHYSEPKLGSKNIEKLAKSNTKSFVKTNVRAVVIEQRLVIKTIGMYDHGMSFDYNQDDNQRSLSTKGKELNSTSFTRSGKPNDSKITKILTSLKICIGNFFFCFPLCPFPISIYSWWILF